MQLNESQKNEMSFFILKYKELNSKIEEIEFIMKELSEKSDAVIKELELVRKNEKEWHKENAKKLGISENDFINICLNS